MVLVVVMLAGSDRDRRGWWQCTRALLLRQPLVVVDVWDCVQL
jgi:hypothetical protein